MQEYLDIIWNFARNPELLQSAGRLALAAGLGAVIGAEREHHGRSAGLRTQLLVCMGAALAMVVSIHFGAVYQNSTSHTLSVDPARVAYGIMAGIGFLGGGVIIRSASGVRGVTTAASLWCTSAIGLACGFGMYGVAIFATIVVFFALVCLTRLDEAIGRSWTKVLRLTLPAQPTNRLDQLRSLLKARGIRVTDACYERNFQAGTETFILSISLRSKSLDNALLIRNDLPDLLNLAIGDA